MAKGIIYVMTTVVPGLIKIGKTGSSNFDNRMYQLERNGYSNVVGLKKYFAIEVEDYDEKEILLDEIFSKSRLENTELFALDVNLVVQLLSSFEGRQVYPDPEEYSKEEVFDEASDSKSKHNIPDGIYSFGRKIKGRIPKAKLKVTKGRFIVLKGSECLPCNKEWMPKARANAPIMNGILQEDVEVKSLSTAGWIVIGGANNGWDSWQDEKGQPIRMYREK